MTNNTQSEPGTSGQVTFELNGNVISHRVSPTATLLDILRDFGCITSALRVAISADAEPAPFC